MRELETKECTCRLALPEKFAYQAEGRKTETDRDIIMKSSSRGIDVYRRPAISGSGLGIFDSQNDLIRLVYGQHFKN